MVIYVSPNKDGEQATYEPLLREIFSSRRNLFLTGRAGTGKTTLLKRLLRAAGEKAVVLAPTGLAAASAHPEPSASPRGAERGAVGEGSGAREAPA